MHSIDRIKPVQALTHGQQKMLQIILKLPHFPFKTSDILAISSDFDDILAASAVIGSLANLGILNKLAGGRDKRWAVAQPVLVQSEQLMIDLNAALEAGVPHDDQSELSIDDALAKLLEK